MVTLPKNCWPKVLGSVVIQLYGECTLSVDRALTEHVYFCIFVETAYLNAVTLNLIMLKTAEL